MDGQPQGNGPLPNWVWSVLGGMIAAALVCLVLAVVLGRDVRHAAPAHSEASGPEVVRKTLKAPVEPLTQPAAETAPMDLPDLEDNDLSGPTEVPPPETPVSPTPVHEEPVSLTTPLPVEPLPETLLWQTHAVPVQVPAGAPRLSIVIDDMGGIIETSREAAMLPKMVTLSFFPWSKAGVELAHEAYADGHEVMIHVPMEALLHGTKVMHPGPDALTVGMTPEEIEQALLRNIAPLEDIAVGVNNHMGSRFTEWEPGMRAVLTVLQRKGMMFMDSKTAAPTATAAAAEGLDLPVVTREVFLDHDPDPEAVRKELARAVELAHKNGHVLAIGHPLPNTLAVLNDELPRIVSSGVVLVPVTNLISNP